MTNILFVGLDVHKTTIAVAVAEGGRGGEVRELGNFLSRPDHIRELVERQAKGGRSLAFCYEAGPCGYALYRQLIALGHECVVVAPSIIPMKAGDRVKTDRRDAVMLAKLHRAGELTAVWVPDDAHEAMRDLIRARSTAVRVRARGYKWNANGHGPRRSWFIDVPDEQKAAELAFLQAEVCGREIDVPMQRIDAYNRFSARV